MITAQIDDNLSVMTEIFSQDAYWAKQTFKPGEVWMDVGCHHGWWSVLARSHGARIGVAVDSDAGAIERYHEVTRDFNSGVFVYNHTVTSADELIHMARSAPEKIDAIKIDIQGAEGSVFNPTSHDLVKMAREFPKVLVEVHSGTNDITAFIQEFMGFWPVVWSHMAHDSLTGEPTVILLGDQGVNL
jgi:hypothetical protein